MIAVDLHRGPSANVVLVTGERPLLIDAGSAGPIRGPRARSSARSRRSSASALAALPWVPEAVQAVSLASAALIERTLAGLAERGVVVRDGDIYDVTVPYARWPSRTRRASRSAPSNSSATAPP